MKDATGDGVIGNRRYYMRLEKTPMQFKILNGIVWTIVSIGIIGGVLMLLMPDKIFTIIVGGIK
jgi:hypothetical protein